LDVKGKRIHFSNSQLQPNLLLLESNLDLSLGQFRLISENLPENLPENAMCLFLHSLQVRRRLPLVDPTIALLGVFGEIEHSFWLPLELLRRLKKLLRQLVKLRLKQKKSTKGCK
jgi:hypothetical protein